MTTSLAMICGDAHRDALVRCINSVMAPGGRYAPLVDSVVVCWNGSRGEMAPDSNTLYGVDLVPQTWKGDFAAARNESFALVDDADWILWLDADDVVVPDPRHRPLSDILTTLPPDIGCVWLPYLYTEDLPMQIPRLVRRSAGPWRWVNPVHEELISDAPTTPGWTILDYPKIRHAPVQSEEKRQSRNVEIMDRLFAENFANRTPWLLYHRARAYESDGDAIRAVDMYLEALSKAKGVDAHRRWPIAVAGSLCALRAQSYSLALRMAEESIRARPDLPEAYYLTAIVQGARGERRRALIAYRLGEALSEDEAAGRSRPIRLGRTAREIERGSDLLRDVVSTLES